MHNHFRCSCSLCAFSLRKRFLHISRSALQSSIHYSKNKQTNKQTLSGASENFIHHPFKQHSAISSESDWLHINDDSSDNLLHQKSSHRKESTSERRRFAFLRCSFCNVREFYAFNDPCFAAQQKQVMADYTERALLPLFSIVSLP